jgi:hypothetical protein
MLSFKLIYLKAKIIQIGEIPEKIIEKYLFLLQTKINNDN